MVYNRNKGYCEQCKEETYTIQKIWGCFADVVSYKRYESFIGSNDSTYYILESLTKEEIEEVYVNLEKVFNRKIDIEIRKKDSFKRFVTKVKKYVRSECK